MLEKLKFFTSFFDGLFSSFSVSMKQCMASFCEIQTADSKDTLVAHDGSLISVIKISGVTTIIGEEEFQYIQNGLRQSLQTSMSQPGHHLQFFFGYNKDDVRGEIEDIFSASQQTADRIGLKLDDLFSERIANLSDYCAHEEVCLVVWTKLNAISPQQLKQENKDKARFVKDNKVPPFKHTQNVLAAVTNLREAHDAFIRGINADLKSFNIVSKILNVHEATYAMRKIADPEFTAREWKPVLPGDKITIKEIKNSSGEVTDILWPAMAQQILPRDGERIDLRTARMGDRIYSTVSISLFPQEVQSFARLFSRTLQSHIPWRMSFMVESHGLGHSNLRSALASVLSFTSSQNRLLADSLKLLEHVNLTTDDAVVRLKVTASTWADDGDKKTLRSRASILARAIQGWGSCNISEVSGDSFEGMVSTMMGVTSKSPAHPSIAPLSDVLHMLPLFRPASPWDRGAILFRSPDGKPWPYQPGSRNQTTFVDLFYARPGSGKSVLSNAINLAVCLSSGIQRLPRVAIIDIGPSSSGFISVIKDALPVDKKHLAAHHRLRMTPEYAINPFDTQLGSRVPSPQERSFLVNFLTLLATPVGSDTSYDGIPDMAGLIIDDLYKSLMDDANPTAYAQGVEESVDGVLEEIGFFADEKTTWWEVVDALFLSGFTQSAILAQRYAVPVLSQVASICRTSAIEDLYGKIVAPTSEPLIHAFSRMISSAVREYSIISQVTQFDLDEAKVVALDLDEVAKSGGDAANRQTAVMYMLARYVLGKNFYLTDENISDMPEAYRDYHNARILEAREDPKRLVYDEFHRTAKVQAVRDQVIVDMREGRKWNVQVALLSQSLDDFDSVMVEFATSIFIMEAGPEIAVAKTAKVFGLSSTAQTALRNRVHGPRQDGTTFLAQFATKQGVYTQLLTSTLGPIELWALSTTAEDANLRNRLYKHMSPKRTRQVLARRFPGGSATHIIEEMLADYKVNNGFIDEQGKDSVIDQLIEDILEKEQELRA